MKLPSFISLCIVAILPATMLFSCENDLKVVNGLMITDSLPDISVNNIRVKQSENGYITLELTAPEMRSYQQGKDPYTLFPRGVKIIFFDSLMRPKSDLSADYGISWDNRNIMEARGNVVIRNILKGEQLNTEYMQWDQNSKKGSTNEFVKITTPDKIIMGKGMESDELFDNWVIRNVQGTIYVKDQP